MDLDPNTNPDFYNNLMQFGLATMAAGSQPGATTLGAIGQGGLAATQSARQLAQQRAAQNLQNAQANYYGAQTTKDLIPLQLQLQQAKLFRQTQGLPTDDIDQMMTRLNGMTAGASPGKPVGQGQTPIGMPSAPSAGNSGIVSTQASGASNAATGATAPATGGDQTGFQGVPLAVWQGQVAPSKQQAATMANTYDLAGRPDMAKTYRDYAMATPEGYALSGNYTQGAVPGGPKDPRVIEQNSGAEAWGKVGPSLYEKTHAPYDLREGGIHVDPGTGQYVQGEQRVTAVGPNGEHYLTPAPMGISTGNIYGGGQPTGASPSAPGQQPAGGTPSLPPSAGGMGVGGGLTGGAVPPGAPAPAQAAPGPTTQGAPQRIQTELAPGQKEIIEGAAKNYNEEGKKAYQSAQDLKGSLEFIQRDLDTMGPDKFLAVGSGADARASFAKALNTTQQVMGMQPTFDPNKIGAWEDFKKESTLGGMKGLSAMFGGSREAASIIHTSIGAFPQPTSSYQGAQLLTSAFNEAANREIDKRNFETNMIATNGGNLTGANEAFNEKYPPAMYSRRAISKVQPYEISPDTSLEEVQKRFLPGTYISMNGKIKQVPGTPGVPLMGAQ